MTEQNDLHKSNSHSIDAHTHQIHLNLVAGAPLSLHLPPSPTFFAIQGSARGVDLDKDSVVNSILTNTSLSRNKEWRSFLSAYVTLLSASHDEIWPSLVKCLTTLMPLFMQSGSHNSLIIPALRALTTAIPKASIKQGGADASSHAAGLLSRLLAASNVDTPHRRVVLVHTTNMLAWTYFKLHRLHSLSTALKAVIPLEDSLESLYSFSDCATYRYWRARALLAEWRVDAAFHHFAKAYNLCYVHAHANRRRIASYWFTTALVLRKCPTADALDRNALSWPFAELFMHARKGDAAALYAALDEQRTRTFFVRMGVYTMLKEKMECVVHRGLLRRTLHTYMLLKNSPNPIIPLSVLVKTLQQAHPDEDLDVDDAEAVAVSLIDQGFIGASIQHSSRTLVFAKSDQSAFPVNNL